MFASRRFLSTQRSDATFETCSIATRGMRPLLMQGPREPVAILARSRGEFQVPVTKRRITVPRR